MIYNSYEEEYTKDLKLINNELSKILKNHKDSDNVITQAMNYVIENGGKRLRPVLALEFCKACGKPVKKALPFACAIELIHSTSLIQDDLPIMDNAPTRRGKPSCHVKFGDSIAVLASDALSVLAFEILISYSQVNKSLTLKAAQSLVNAIGINGLVGGQTLDLLNQNDPVDNCIDIDELKRIYSLKTETLFLVAAKLGCIAGKANSKKMQAATKYAKNIGLAYQIVDDILDITASEDILGKKPLADVQNQKTTYPSLIGIEESRKFVKELTEDAIDAVQIFGEEKCQFLKGLALRLEKRQY